MFDMRAITTHRDFHHVSAKALRTNRSTRAIYTICVRYSEGPGQSEEIEVQANPTDL